MRQTSRYAIVAATILPLLSTSPAISADMPSFTIMIKDHRFLPPETSVPAGKRIELVIENQDPTPEEFESNDLRREKIVPPKGKVSVYVGPLPAGVYGFFGEFNPKTAQGKLIAK